jgi:hypothetical protein
MHIVSGERDYGEPMPCTYISFNFNVSFRCENYASDDTSRRDAFVSVFIKKYHDGIRGPQ